MKWTEKPPIGQKKKKKQRLELPTDTQPLCGEIKAFPVQIHQNKTT